jgi:Putative auto-transporter adhesin, head GIN domain
MKRVARHTINKPNTIFIMKRIILLIAAVIFLTNVEAQYSTKENITDFNAIEVNSAAHVELVQSDSNYVTLSAKDSMKKMPRLDVKGGVLEINSAFRGTMEVHVKNITSIKVDDAARVSCIDTLRTNNLTIHVSDAGKADILVHAKTIKARGNDASSVTLVGSADSLDVKATDGSHMDASNLKTHGVYAISSDGSSLSVWAMNSIDGNATDGSTIHIKGNPAHKNTSNSDWDSIYMDDSGKEITQYNGNNRFMRMTTNDSDGKKRFEVDGDAYMGAGFVAGGSNGVNIKYGSSREFTLGFGYVKKIVPWNWVGLDLYYKSTDYYIGQDSGKTFPDRTLHQEEKISFQNFGGLVFDRFFFGKKLFLDGGIYGDWTFHSKLVTWDDASSVSSVKTIDRNLSYVNPTNYGLNFRFGFRYGVSVYFNYRLSGLFQNPAAPAAAYPHLPVYTVGIILGSF